ncbi:hypothetical protein SAMN05444392_1145 [Seinonella peptonophila]|uniref:Uncharacterized protein n=1 Tax=Seinonella peptonophila TaxID=112248 RepID=A0A1M5AHV9_9BACL|nr:hypothetical protein [Seinonella peptonophila]SHF29704.1 hypothetical protein SAMN05444392_1145 [Seinonella peptonophila]
MFQVEIRGLEEAQHPFYIIVYGIMQDGNEWLQSVARFVNTNQGGKVQFLEPDLKKMQQLENGIELINQVEQTILEEGRRLSADQS